MLFDHTANFKTRPSYQEPSMHANNPLSAIIDSVMKDQQISEESKNIILRNLTQLKNTKVNILITGATGCGKSSTINALFNTEVAKVGQGVDPETMDITQYELENIILFDSPGLGDGKEADRRHSKNITDLLLKREADGNLLIDLVLVILDGSSRDLGTSFELIENVIIPSLGSDTSRLLIAINQADMAMKGRFWDKENNQPEPQLIQFLNEKVESTRRRIHEATGVDVTPIYYSAGYKEGRDMQNPYNLSKLLAHILRHTKQEKRAVFVQDINQDKRMWEDDDELEDYRTEIKQSIFESIKSAASKGADIGGEIGSLFGAPGRAIGSAVGAVVGGVVGAVTSFFSSWF